VTVALSWTRARPLGACFAALLAGAVLARYGLSAAGLIAGITTAVLVVLSLIDFETHRLPNRIVLPSAAFVLAARLATEPGHWQAWLGASLAAFACFLVLALIVPGGLGMGDVKLMLLLGAALGGAVLPALVLGVFAGGAAGIVVLVREGRSARRKAIPYGPFLAFGAIAMMLLYAP
jgi:prepilin signal peptidase PulO-like enzyme (type II secretory pathway)